MSVNSKLNLARSYDADARRRSEAVPAEWKVRERTKFLDFLTEEEKRKLLEIGAGTGIDGKFFMDNGFDVTCIDLSQEMVRFCKDKGLRAMVMDFYSLDFPNRHFDAVYALNCLLHVPKQDIHQVFNEINRVLKDNGLFYLGLYGGSDSEGIWEDDWCEPKRFFASYTDSALETLVQQYFELVSFDTVPLEAGKPHFQSVVLRKQKK
jgi:SAM-dependent methyltransferase